MDERERVLLTLAGVRAFMGVFWLVNVLWRLPTDFGKGEYWGLPRTLDVARHYALTPLLRSLVDDVLIPHLSVLGWILFFVGLATGLSLVLGYMTRLGAVLGLIQAVAITLLLGQRTGRMALRLPHAHPALGAAAAPPGRPPDEPRRRARPRPLSGAARPTFRLR